MSACGDRGKPSHQAPTVPPPCSPRRPPSSLLSRGASPDPTFSISPFSRPTALAASGLGSPSLLCSAFGRIPPSIPYPHPTASSSMKPSWATLAHPGLSEEYQPGNEACAILGKLWCLLLSLRWGHLVSPRASVLGCGLGLTHLSDLSWVSPLCGTEWVLKTHLLGDFMTCQGPHQPLTFSTHLLRACRVWALLLSPSCPEKSHLSPLERARSGQDGKGAHSGHRAGMEVTGGVGGVLPLPGAVKRVWEPQSGALSLNWKVRTCGACVSVLDTERKCGSQSGRGLRVRFKGLSLTGETHQWTHWIHQCLSA